MKALLINIFIIFICCKSIFAQPKIDLSIHDNSSFKMLGGYNTEGSLHIFIYDNSNMQVYRYLYNNWYAQWYGQCSKSIWLYADGYSYNASGSYFQGNSISLNTVNNTNENSNTNILVLEKEHYIRIKQYSYYPPGTDIIYYQWEILNISNDTIHDLRFFTGGDTYLFNSDNGAGFWSSSDNQTGVYKNVENKLYRYFMEGITIPYAYESRYYWAVYLNVIINNLRNVVDDNEDTDNGLSLEFRKDFIEPGGKWVVKAVEKYSSSASTDLVVTAPLSGFIVPGDSIDLIFNLRNLSSCQAIADLITLIDIHGWQVRSVSPKMPLSLPAGSNQNIILRVKCPIGCPLGSIAKVTLNAVNNNGTASDYLYIIAAAVPSIVFDPADQHICEGQTASFKICATNADTYQWQEFKTKWRNIIDDCTYAGAKTNTLIINNSADSINENKYRCLVSNVHGSVSSSVATLNIYNKPDVCLGNDTVLSYDQTLLLDAGPGISYDWSLPGLQGRFVKIDYSLLGIGTTKISVIVRNANNCIDKDTIAVTYYPFTELASFADDIHSFSVYPNPSSGTVTIDFIDDIGEFYIEIFNIQGRLVKTVRSDKSYFQLNINELQKGICLFKIKTSNQLFFIKVLLI